MTEIQYDVQPQGPLTKYHIKGEHKDSVEFQDAGNKNRVIVPFWYLEEYIKEYKYLNERNKTSEEREALSEIKTYIDSFGFEQIDGPARSWVSGSDSDYVTIGITGEIQKDIPIDFNGTVSMFKKEFEKRFNIKNIYDTHQLTLFWHQKPIFIEENNRYRITARLWIG